MGEFFSTFQFKIEENYALCRKSLVQLAEDCNNRWPGSLELIF